MLTVTLFILLLFEVHHHETSLLIQRPLPQIISQNCQSFAQQEFPSCTHARRHPVVNDHALLPPAHRMAQP